MIHLDTSFLIRALVRHSGEDRRLRTWLAVGTPLSISAIAWAEFLCGPVRPGDADLAAEVLPEPVPLEASDAIMTARLFSLAGRRGSFVDCMIAAAALRAGASLATANPTDFRRFEAAGLKLVAA